MRNLIRRTAHWLSLLLAPGTRAHRAGARSVRWAPAAEAPKPTPLPRHRSPYGLHIPLDGSETRLARPYLPAHDGERALQQRRRLALVLAADFGIDLDRHLVGMPEMAA